MPNLSLKFVFLWINFKNEPSHNDVKGYQNSCLDSQAVRKSSSETGTGDKLSSVTGDRSRVLGDCTSLSVTGSCSGMGMGGLVQDVRALTLTWGDVTLLTTNGVPLPEPEPEFDNLMPIGPVRIFRPLSVFLFSHTQTTSI